MKWMSNSREVLSKIPEADRAKPTLDLHLENLPVERTLGVQWDVEKDAFLFKVREPHKPTTKRGILSAVSSLYDPMGFVCPVVLEAKKILQRLWKLNLGWDDLIPEEEVQVGCLVTSSSTAMSPDRQHSSRHIPSFIF